MTGFGSAEKNGCKVEIRSLNSRFLDIHIKAPSVLNQHEMAFRNLLKERFARGKFDVAVSLSENVSADFRVNTAIAGRLYAAFRGLQEELGLPGEPDINMMAGFHSLYMETAEVVDADTVLEVFRQSMDGLEEMRRREGKILAAELARLLDSLEGMNELVRKAAGGDAIRAVRDKFNERLQALLGDKDLDEGRVLQEATLMAIKLDITEEIARVDSHIRQFRGLLNGHAIIGRKLDFIVQEFNREINTIASKSVDYGITSLTVEMKAVAEKIKEQVQNIQ